MMYLMYIGKRSTILIALILFVVGSLSDSLDGITARTFGKVTRIGAVLDRICDKIFVTSTLLMLAILRYIKGIDLVPIFIILFRDLAVSGLRELSISTIPSNYFAKVKTVIQTLAVILIFLSALKFQLFYSDIFLLWISAILTIISFMNYLCHLEE